MKSDALDGLFGVTEEVSFVSLDTLKTHRICHTWMLSIIIQSGFLCLCMKSAKQCLNSAVPCVRNAAPGLSREPSGTIKQS